MSNWHSYLKPHELRELRILDFKQEAISKQRTVLRNRAKQRKWREAQALP